MQDHKGLSGSHHAFFDSVVGNWELPEFGKYSLISMKNISHLLKENKLKEVDFKDIAWRGKHFFPNLSGDNCWCCGGKRYAGCDIKYPGILIDNVSNPYDNRYRMIDGKHRLQKMLLSGMTKSLFYVLEYDDVKNYVHKGDLNQLSKFLSKFSKDNTVLGMY